MEVFAWVCLIWVLFGWLFNGSSHLLLCSAFRFITCRQWYTSIIIGQKTKNENSSQEYVSQLPRDLLGIMVDKLTCFEDYLSFSEVCRFTRRFAREERHYQKPWVMLGNKPGDKTRPFYSPLEGKFYSVKLPKVVRRSWCCGSYEGWLVMAHKTRGNFMYNPIAQKHFRLPTHQLENIDPDRNRPFNHTKHIKKCPYFLSKIVLSAVPTSLSSSPLLAAGIAENDKILVTVCRPGLDNKWRHFCPLTLQGGDLLSPRRLHLLIDDDKDQDQEEEVEVKESPYQGYVSHVVTDIIFYRGQLYAVSTNGCLYVVKVSNDTDFSLERVHVHPLKLMRKEWSECNLNYLVESCHGQLLMVVRIRTQIEDRGQKGWWGFRTKKFLVFKLDECNGEPFRWVKVESLGDQVLFLGQQNYSRSISSFDVGTSPGKTTGKGNTIYFTDHYRSNYYAYNLWFPLLYRDSGVYHLDDGRIDQLLPPELDHHLYTFKRHPIMFTPNPC